MIRAGLIGVGKMGISHYAILGAHPDVQMSAICDSSTYVTSALRKHTGIETFKNHKKMIESAKLDCVFVATPSSSHFEVASYAMEKGLHVFVEKPLCLDPKDSRRLADLAQEKGCANQVGYHNRFIGTFRETARLVKAGALGEIYHVSGTAFGPVVIRPKAGSTWRSKKSEGGGCLHDYASHVVDLMNFVVGPPEQVLAAQLRSIYSQDVEDAVYALFRYPSGTTGVLETNWSDETYRKMSTPLDVLKARAAELARQVGSAMPAATIEISESQAYLGSGSLPTEAIPSFVVTVSLPEISAAELARQLRLDRACVFGRIENDRVCLDVRTLTDEQVPAIAAAFGRLAV